MAAVVSECEIAARAVLESQLLNKLMCSRCAELRQLLQLSRASVTT